MNGFDALRLGLIGAIVMAALLLVARFLAPFRFAILSLLVLLTLAYLTWRLWVYLQARRAARRYATTTVGQIGQELEQSRSALENHQLAVDKLRKSVTELRRSIPYGDAHRSTETQARTEELLQAYEQEIELRQRKVSFYQLAIQQLEKLLAHHQWLATLDQKTAELAQYQRQHPQENDQLAKLSWTLEQENAWLDSLEDIRTRLEASATVSAVDNMNVALKDLLV